MVSGDPYTLLYDAIVACFKRRDFKVIDWAEASRDPQQDILTESDYPEFQIRPSGLTGQIGDTSSTHAIKRTFQLMLNTGDQRLKTLAFPMEWKITQALYELKYEGLENLKFKGRNFVLTTEINSAQIGISDPVLNRGAIGWSALWDIEVTMSFAKGDLI